MAARRNNPVLQRERAANRLAGRGVAAVLLATFALAFARPANAAPVAGPAGSVVYVGADGGVFSIPLAGGSPAELWKPATSHTASEPQWSPSGKLVAFVGGDGNVWTVSASGDDAHALTSQATPPSNCSDEVCQNQGTRADSPRWSPDGSQVSYRLVDDAAKASIWTVSVGGGTPAQVTSAGDACLFNEGFTPAGAPLYSRCAQSDGGTNATFSVSNGSASQLLAGSQVVFAPSGSRIAFARQSQTSTSVNVALYTAKSDGSAAALVAAGGQDPAWSSSGLLAYQVNTRDGRAIHVYDLATGNDTTVTLGMLAGWSADGGWLVYTTTDDSGNSQIVRVLPDGSGATQVAEGRMPSVSAS
jgi:Tol biopolymer transport system component